jgi:hypothetical protein
MLAFWTHTNLSNSEIFDNLLFFPFINIPVLPFINSGAFQSKKRTYCSRIWIRKLKKGQRRNENKKKEEKIARFLL